MHRKTLIAAAAGVLALRVGSAGDRGDGPMRFEPIAGSAYDQLTADWTEPFVVPDNCTQRLVIDETMFDIYPGVDDLTDMNTVNETGGRRAGTCTAPRRSAPTGRCRWST